MQKRLSTLALSMLFAFGGANFAHAEPVKIKDVLDREVTVDLPAKRVVLGFYYQDYMAVGGEKALDNVVGFSKKYGLAGRRQAGNYSAKMCRN